MEIYVPSRRPPLISAMEESLRALLEKRVLEEKRLAAKLNNKKFESVEAQEIIDQTS